jgi:hypothetical protein
MQVRSPILSPKLFQFAGEVFARLSRATDPENWHSICFLQDFLLEKEYLYA